MACHAKLTYMPHVAEDLLPSNCNYVGPRQGEGSRLCRRRLVLIFSFVSAMILVVAGTVLGQGMDAGGATLYRDEEAGVRFPWPFPGSTRHGGAELQVRLDIAGAAENKAQGSAAWPPLVRLTSGVFAAGGMPYALVALRQDLSPAWWEPSCLPILLTVLTGKGGAKLSSWHVDPWRGRATAALETGAGRRSGLRAKVVLQSGPVGTVQIAYYFRDATDEAAFDRLVEGLSPLGNGQAHESGPWNGTILGMAWQGLALAVLALAVAGELARRRRRRRQRWAL